MRYGSTQWSLPTAETYSELIDVFKINEMEGFREYEDLRREYEDLRREYEDLRPVHNLDANHKNVWEFRRDKGRNWHSCQKPQDILTRIINTSSKPGATVLDPFMGSGSTAVACLSTGREFIGIENDQETYNLANERIQEVLSDEDTNNGKSTP